MTNPPPTRREAIVDVLHGVPVADPYRWLEDGDDPEVRDWVSAQNAVTRSALDIHPDRERWRQRLVELMGVPITLEVHAAGGRIVTLERASGANPAGVVVRSLDDPDHSRVIIDPVTTTDDGVAAVDWLSLSSQGTHLAYGISEGGSENSVLRVINLATNEIVPDAIPYCRAASVAWEPDTSGFFYTAYPDGDDYHRTVFHHTLGDDPANDPVVWADPERPTSWPIIDLSPDGRYLMVTSGTGWASNDVAILDRQTDEWTTVVMNADARSSFVFDGPDRLVGVTTIDAPRGRLVAVNLAEIPSSPDGWTTLVAEREGVLGTPQPIDGGYLMTVTEAAIDQIEWWSADGAHHHRVDLPGPISVSDLATDTTTGEAFAVVTGFDRPAQLIRMINLGAPAAPTATTWPASSRRAPVELNVELATYASLDGTEIGAFVIRAAGAPSSADTPTILFGYGGFAISLSPHWSPMIAAWCEAGGQYVIAGLRGGLEHGEEWHQAGRRANKQNVYDDFHAAADWLVATGRTSRDRLGIEGRSNGGLLVGVALTQRPDLCRAVSCGVPLLDMVRFPNFLIARLWTDEYGDPDIDDEFGWLHAYSPYHHVVDRTDYPAVLFWTADGDSRVDPLHARKMAAAVQAATRRPTERPILFHQEGRAGHGVGKPVTKKADEQADMLTFFSWQLGGADLWPRW